MKKGKIVIAAIAVLAVLAGAGWYIFIEMPHSKAVDGFNVAAQSVEAQNSEVRAQIEKSQEIIDSGKQPLDDAATSTATAAIEEANNAIRAIPDMPSNTEDIISGTKSLEEPLDYSATIEKLEESRTALETSIKQMELVTNPSEQFVIERLTGIETITGMEAVTEDNDPNGHLNKDGGYTSTVYFSSSLVDQDSVHGATIVDKGTACGGAIEVYANSEDAISRDKYLGAFDGSVLSNGKHTVIGTVVVRVSDEMTATQQNDLSQAIITRFTAV